MAKTKTQSNSLLIKRSFEYTLDSSDIHDIALNAIESVLDDCPQKKQWPELREWRVKTGGEKKPSAGALLVCLKHDELCDFVQAVFPDNMAHTELFEFSYGMIRGWEEMTLSQRSVEAAADWMKEHLTAVMLSDIRDSEEKEKKAEAQKIEAEQQKLRDAIDLCIRVGCTVNVPEGVVKPGLSPSPVTPKFKIGVDKATAGAVVRKASSFRALIVAAGRIMGSTHEAIYKRENSGETAYKLFNVGTKAKCESIQQLLAKVGLIRSKVTRNVSRPGYSFTVYVPITNGDNWGYFESIQNSLANLIAGL